jgi:hypothetical protein
MNQIACFLAFIWPVIVCITALQLAIAVRNHVARRVDASSIFNSRNRQPWLAPSGLIGWLQYLGKVLLYTLGFGAAVAGIFVVPFAIYAFSFFLACQIYVRSIHPLVVRGATLLEIGTIVFLVAIFIVLYAWFSGRVIAHFHAVVQ